MKKILCTLTSVIFVWSFICSAYAAEKIAVLDFKSILVSEELGFAVSEILRTELAGFEEYTVIERGKLKEILHEQALQLSGSVDSETAVEIGKLVGAKMVVNGSIVKTGEVYTINSRFVDVETGIVKDGKNVQGQGENEIPEMVKELALIITSEAVDMETPVDSTPTQDKTSEGQPGTKDGPPSGYRSGRLPREIVEACQDKNEQAACQFEHNGDLFEAVCHTLQNQLACVLSQEDASDDIKKQWDRLDRNHDGFLDFNEARGDSGQGPPPSGDSGQGPPPSQENK